MRELTLGTTLTKFGDTRFSIDLDRGQFRHGWLLGKSGTGKSTLLRNIIVDATRKGWGVIGIDPHGDLVQDCFNYIPPSRIEDVSLIDPENDRAPDLGIFNYENDERAIQAFLSIIEAHAGAGWGPETAHIFRCCADAIVELERNPTILHIYKILSRPEYAKALLQKSKNPIVRDFYAQYFVDMNKRERVRNFSHPLNKIEELMRPGLVEYFSQTRHLNFVELLDKQKILFCKLPKGIMGDRPAKVLGSFILSQIHLAAFHRKRRSKEVLVVIDEVHNFLDGIDFETMLAEGRKFGIHYLFATQTTRQMRDERRGIYNDLIAFGNTSHLFSFRVSGEDSQNIALNIGENDSAPGLVRLANYHFTAWTIRGNTPILAENVQLEQFPPKGDAAPAHKAIAQARHNTGKPKHEIQKDVALILA